MKISLAHLVKPVSPATHHNVRIPVQQTASVPVPTLRTRSAEEQMQEDVKIFATQRLTGSHPADAGITHTMSNLVSTT